VVSQWPLCLAIPEEHAGKRLDKVLAQLTGLGRKRIGELFAEGCVRVEGKLKRPSHLSCAGENVEIAVPTQHPEPTPQQFELHVVKETDSWVIVDKPAGQPSVPLPHRPGSSLATLLQQKYPEMRDIGYRAGEAGLLHRLDTGTSGLLLAARSPDAFRRLRAALSQGEIEKRYFAIVASTPPLTDQLIDLPIAPHPKRSRRVVVVPHHDPRGKPARSEIQVLRRTKDWTLVDVKVAHAYRHQIRVHLSHLGVPLLGDTQYGGITHPALTNRHALHAHHISWPGDAAIPALHAESPVPPPFLSVLDSAPAPG
jgi:23S rRNA pseudouridine1911/1915/1917 synthase